MVDRTKTLQHDCQRNLNLLGFRHKATGTLTKELMLKMRHAAACSPYLLVVVTDCSSCDTKLITIENFPQTYKVSKTFEISTPCTMVKHVYLHQRKYLIVYFGIGQWVNHVHLHHQKYPILYFETRLRGGWTMCIYITKKCPVLYFGLARGVQCLNGVK